MSQHEKLRATCEGAVFTACALALSYFKIPTGVSFGGFGGSIDLVMVPLIIFSVRRGALWGMGAGLVFGTAKFFFAGGAAINWQSMLLDYSLAYMAVGCAGFYSRGSARFKMTLGALTGCIARFTVHFISGVTIYAQYVPDDFLGLSMKGAAVYSILYNGTYMLPNSVIAVFACLLLAKPLNKFISVNNKG